MTGADDMGLIMGPHARKKAAMQAISTTMLASYFALLFFGTHWPWLPTRADWMDLSHRLAVAPDKIAHTVAFGGLSLLVAFWLRARRRNFHWRHDALMAAGLIAYAHVDEVTQYLVPHRTPDVYDLLANLVGIALGLTTFYVAWWCVAVVRPPASAWR